MNKHRLYFGMGLSLCFMGLAACQKPNAASQAAPTEAAKAAEAAAAPKVETDEEYFARRYKMPDEDTIPDNQLGEAIRLGMKIVNDTYNMVPDHVGNKLRCTSCHRNNGTVPYGLPWVGSSAIYPRYRARNAGVVSMHERINGCFRRSMNGKALPLHSKEMGAIIVFIKWLSQGVPIGEQIKGSGLISINHDLIPDPKNGKRIYDAKCVSCHQKDGSGMYPGGTYIYPAVAGPDSFNDGAGMARLYKAAAFIKHNMPLNQGETLTEQESVDVAQYLTHLDRPVFPDKAKDWPNGGRPKDAR